jgi:hypothetical protein
LLGAVDCIAQGNIAKLLLTGELGEPHVLVDSQAIDPALRWIESVTLSVIWQVQTMPAHARAANLKQSLSYTIPICHLNRRSNADRS